MNESSLSAELIARWIGDEAVANGIIEKTPEGYVFEGNSGTWRITISATLNKKHDTKRIREGIDLGYN